MGACCPHCGVDDCEAKFDACLDRDFSDPEYGVVHHLMVGAYMMQHGRYTDENVQGTADFLLRHLDEPPSEATKREIRRWADGPYRVIRRAGESARDTADVLWPLSIGDIDLTTADRYRTCVRRWAEAVARTARRNSPRSF
ncbi:Uncharacterised protein [Mycolicibacterium vanbaalenii]|uniref:Uncharacterized protein n=1 Tax=Mycolicibacterium vanbaalenii TaxID=110539 RepID=A0A5S9R9Q0_MYCVN|nr:DUF5946 family protein [Mycolicibacterium vanbaalenii]CAA0092167.1 Uncharacterised protein [Mycolicibacterium vanbaalenii]CAA0133970.1 Uncharacterised protein [Mycolicibacterium vanbaalenii]